MEEGFLYMDGGEAVINTAMKLNNASSGGAISVSGGNLSVTGGEFTGNKATANGGAINATKSFTVNDTVFNGNSADYDGGAVYINGGTDTVTVEMANTAFTSNNAPDGGAIFAKGASTTTKNTDCDFTENGDAGITPVQYLLQTVRSILSAVK